LELIKSTTLKNKYNKKIRVTSGQNGRLKTKQNLGVHGIIIISKLTKKILSIEYIMTIEGIII
jgi:hypothetical protein